MAGLGVGLGSGVGLELGSAELGLDGRVVCSCVQHASTHGASAAADALALRQSDASRSSGRSPSRTLMPISVSADSSSAHGSWRVSTCGGDQGSNQGESWALGLALSSG